MPDFSIVALDVPNTQLIVPQITDRILLPADLVFLDGTTMTTASSPKTILNGLVPPPANIGGDGDFYVDTVNNMWYGPKVTGVWPGGISIAGIPGTGIDHVSQTAGTGAPGTTDTYTMWADIAGTISLGTFLVTNGANGGGGGDMFKTTYDTNADGIVNAADTAAALTGTQAANIITNNAKVTYPATDSTKLAGIAVGATVNSADATLLNRANHTGTQTLSTISDAGTAASKNVPASGNASSAEVVLGSDTRLSAGGGDMTAAMYDPNGQQSDIFAHASAMAIALG